MDSAAKIGELSTKRKEAKEKPKGQQPIAYRTKGYSTKGRVADVSSPESTGVAHTIEPSSIAPKQLAIDDSPLAKAERRSRSIKSLEIDEYVYGLVLEGLVNEDYMGRAAHACTRLGLQRVNQMVLQVRAATCDPAKGQSRQKLLAWKMHGALQLYYKKEFYSSGDVDQPDQRPDSAAPLA